MNDPIKSASNELPPVHAPIANFKELSTAQLCSKIIRPKTPLEILANIKFVMDHDLMLREDFYTEENLKHFSGAEEAKITIASKNRSKSCDRFVLAGFQNTVPIIRQNPPRDNFSIIIDKGYENNRFVWGSIVWHHSTRDPDLIYENLERIMGRPDEIAVPIARINLWAPLPKVREKTHEYGYKSAQYISKLPDTSRFMDLALSYNGILHSGTFQTLKSSVSRK